MVCPTVSPLHLFRRMAASFRVKVKTVHILWKQILVVDTQKNKYIAHFTSAQETVQLSDANCVHYTTDDYYIL